jgi:hypothetical protein
MLNSTHSLPVRQQIEHYLDELPQKQLDFVAELLARLVSSENATQELLNIPGFLESFTRGQADIKMGAVADWRSLRDDI